MILRFVVDVNVNHRTIAKFIVSDQSKMFDPVKNFFMYTVLQIIGLEPDKAELVNIHHHDAEQESCDQCIELSTDGVA